MGQNQTPTDIICLAQLSTTLSHFLKIYQSDKLKKEHVEGQSLQINYKFSRERESDGGDDSANIYRRNSSSKEEKSRWSPTDDVIRVNQRKTKRMSAKRK